MPWDGARGVANWFKSLISQTVSHLGVPTSDNYLHNLAKVPRTKKGCLPLCALRHCVGKNDSCLIGELFFSPLVELLQNLFSKNGFKFRRQEQHNKYPVCFYRPLFASLFSNASLNGLKNLPGFRWKCSIQCKVSQLVFYGKQSSLFKVFFTNYLH